MLSMGKLLLQGVPGQCSSVMTWSGVAEPGQDGVWHDVPYLRRWSSYAWLAR